MDRGREIPAFFRRACVDDLVQADESAATDEENLLSVHLNVFLVRMLTPSLWRHIADSALEDFQERLLDTFSGDVACDTYISVLRPILSISSM